MIRLSASAFDIVWSDLGHPHPPAPLRLGSVGTTEVERGEIRAAVYDGLAERGLLPGGELDRVLRERLDLLASASVFVECEAMVDLAEPEPVRAVAAVTPRAGGVLAVQPRQTVGLSPIRDGEVFAAAVGVLPELAPGPGYGVSLPAAALGDAMEDPVFGDGAGRSGAFEQQVREVLALQARPVLGAGRFSVCSRRAGVLRRLGGVSWFVTDVGAYLGTVEPGRGGEDWMSVAPADGPRLTARLADLVEA